MADSKVNPIATEEQKFLLQRTWLHPLSANLKEVDEQAEHEVGPGLWNDHQRSSVDAALQVLRVVEAYTDGGVVPETNKASTPSALFALWKHSCGDGWATIDYVDGDGEPTDTIAEGQIALYKSLQHWKGLAADCAPHKDSNVFMDLMESEGLHRYLWSRGYLVMWSQVELRIRPQEKDPVLLYMRYFPIGQSMFYAKDEGVPKTKVKALDRGSKEIWYYLAKWSLIQWRGEVRLEEYLARLTVAWKQPDGIEHRWLPGWTADSSAPLSIMRIQFTPAKEESWSGHEALATLAFDPVVDGVGTKEATPQRYNLVAVVRLAKTSQDCTFVRVYSAESGQPTCPKELRARKPAHVDHTWKLGEVGHSYMLYYAKRTEPPTKKPLEVNTSSSYLRALALMRADPSSAGGQSPSEDGHISPADSPTEPEAPEAPKDAPTGPKADRDRVPAFISQRSANAIPIGQRWQGASASGAEQLEAGSASADGSSAPGSTGLSDFQDRLQPIWQRGSSRYKGKGKGKGKGKEHRED